MLEKIQQPLALTLQEILAKFTDFPKSQPIEISILNIFNRIEFTGLKVSADLNVALMNDGSNEGLMSIGHKKRSSNARYVVIITLGM